ncbi:MAG: 2,3-bisphosphoglycerate-independent phosphoglycerate mutase [Alphaproteobacteria bacterium]|nr:2,3-bisphosphoglycerate-independent phosphoglycerate mutase [Alphaproteobacteria bacterium]
MPRRPVVLTILDGWGLAPAGATNAIAAARTPVFDRLMATCPTGQLDASEGKVGLPDGQMGNSEVGHMNLGAGRVVMQDLPRLDAAVRDGSLMDRPAIQRAIQALTASGGRCHLLGLVSPGGVHSHQSHLIALARGFAAAGVPVVLHAVLDGRDTPPRSAAGYVSAVEAALADCPGVTIGTVIGRFYAMDRDKRWDRVEAAWRCLVQGEGQQADSAAAAIAASYAQDQSDEFVRPTVLAGYRAMADGDGLVMGNFRADRAREILHALLDPGFDGFVRPVQPRFAAAVGLVEYSTALNALVDTAFPAERLDHTLGQVVAAAGRRQLRIAETEKYAHVTFFFNGGEETVFEGEERILIPSPKVATYDLAPEMSAEAVTDQVVAAIASDRFDLIVLNYANTDQVGHSGVFEAAVRAVEVVDHCLGRVEAAVRAAGGAMLVTADHGNVEQMWDPDTAGPHTAHTLNPVPAILVNGPADVEGLETGCLADVAPTLLALMGLAAPPVMTGRSLLRQSIARRAG